VSLLNEVRFANLSDQSKARLAALSREVRYTDSVEPTELYVPASFLGRLPPIYWFPRFPTKREVQFANESRLVRLSGPKHTFNATDHAGRDDKDRGVTLQQARTLLDRSVLAPQSMVLKVRSPSALGVF
jgi:hypothetical protein